MSPNATRQVPTPIEMHSTPRAEHCISRRNISNGALRVLYRLNEAGYQAFLVGGAVRDLLLGGHPKDFDIATNATPEQVRGLFRNCRLIGRRFRLAHVVFGREIVEVATFRGTSDDGSGDRHLVDGRIVRDNVYGTIEEDALRRDFTVNALYYDIADFSVRDYVGGMRDLEQRTLRLIGDPDSRYREDPVRMLRAARLAAKLDFTIAPETRGAVRATRLAARRCAAGAAFRRIAEALPLRLWPGELPRAANARVARAGVSGNRARTASPRTRIAFACCSSARWRARTSACAPTSRSRRRSCSPRCSGSRCARLREELDREGSEPVAAWASASAHIMSEQAQRVAIPRRFAGSIEEIWIAAAALRATHQEARVPAARASAFSRGVRFPVAAQLRIAGARRARRVVDARRRRCDHQELARQFAPAAAGRRRRSRRDKPGQAQASRVAAGARRKPKPEGDSPSE